MKPPVKSGKQEGNPDVGCQAFHRMISKEDYVNANNGKNHRAKINGVDSLFHLHSI